MNFYQEVLKRKDDLLSDLTDLLKIESTKDPDTKSEENPMGVNVAKALAHMLDLSTQQGFSTKNYKGYYGYAELEGATPSNEDEHIAVLTHIDVVPATGKWTSPPFEPEIRDGKLYARGAIDDKGPTMAAFYAVKLLKELNLPLKRNVRIIFGTDEESGMSCLKTYREIERGPVGGFAPDAMFPIIHAEKGQMHVKCELTTDHIEAGQAPAEFTLLSFHGGTRPNMVPETAKAIILGDLGDVGEKFEGYVKENGLTGDITSSNDSHTLTLNGISSHSMEPFKGVNAGCKLANFLLGLSLDKRAEKYLALIDQGFHEDHFGKNIGIDHEDDITGPLTVNPAIFHYEKGGKGFVQLNLRYPVSAKAENIENGIGKFLNEYEYVIGEVRNKNPHHVDGDAPMIKALQQAYEEETGQEATLLSSGGNTYASLLPNCVAYGAVFPGKVMTAHQKDEYMEIDDLLKATAIYARALYYLAS
ncbi:MULTISPECIES: dipeptidase PepV [Bacillaceae]|uniref:Dipeptidase PepV n=1 Tax=Evansella alkalicola TaxID=745819 RepID=A0ABS6JQR7_9BACI|nr:MULTISPECIES: dipeptidase PepV [Bacillaceae]MBU9720889.1 dipeptidase PepV [Bacillus alkalicola]